MYIEVCKKKSHKHSDKIFDEAHLLPVNVLLELKATCQLGSADMYTVTQMIMQESSTNRL